MKKRVHIRPILLASVVGVLLLAAWPPSSALALPPRPTPEPKSIPRLLAGAYIELHVSSAPAGLWTVVQWEDAFGDWHDVEGWRGTLDTDDNKVWWVDKSDLGKGPFRWVVTQNGELLATSESLYLPESVGETVEVLIVLPP